MDSKGKITSPTALLTMLCCLHIVLSCERTRRTPSSQVRDDLEHQICRDDGLRSDTIPSPSYALPLEVAKGTGSNDIDQGSDDLDAALHMALSDAEHAARSESKLREFLSASGDLCQVHRAQILVLRDTTKRHRDDAIKSYGALASKNVDWARRDEVLFRLSWELERRGDMAELMGEHEAAITAFGSASRMRMSLGTLYPTSPWLPLALIDEASRRYKIGATMTALEMYKRALKSPTLTDHLRAFLLYRAAWCYLNKGNVGDSSRLFDTAQAVASRHEPEPWSASLRKAIASERR
jgi:hypothetical protein